MKSCYFDIVLFNREEQSEIDVTSGFYVLFGSGINLVKQLFLHIYVYLSSLYLHLVQVLVLASTIFIERWIQL